MKKYIKMFLVLVSCVFLASCNSIQEIDKTTRCAFVAENGSTDVSIISDNNNVTEILVEGLVDNQGTLTEEEIELIASPTKEYFDSLSGFTYSYEYSDGILMSKLIINMDEAELEKIGDVNILGNATIETAYTYKNKELLIDALNINGFTCK